MQPWPLCSCGLVCVTRLLPHHVLRVFLARFQVGFLISRGLPPPVHPLHVNQSNVTPQVLELRSTPCNTKFRREKSSLNCSKRSSRVPTPSLCMVAMVSSTALSRSRLMINIARHEVLRSLLSASLNRAARSLAEHRRAQLHCGDTRCGCLLKQHGATRNCDAPLLLPESVAGACVAAI